MNEMKNYARKFRESQGSFLKRNLPNSKGFENNFSIDWTIVIIGRMIRVNDSTIIHRLENIITEHRTTR